MDLSMFGQSDFLFTLVILVIALGSLTLTRKLLKVPFPFFFMGVLGAIVGIIIGGLLGRVLIDLPGMYGKWLPVVVEIFVTVAIFDLFMAQAMPAAKYLANVFRQKEFDKLAGETGEIVLDTSVLIDGRIEEIAGTGFIFGRLIVPRFVLAELQGVADSQEHLKRMRGRRGLDVLNNLGHNRQIEMEIVDDKYRDREKVDSKLIHLAKERGSKLLTVDYNLSRVAQIQGVEILNINELASSLQPILIPGEDMLVKVIQKGKEKGQGVGYMDDGTMVVVEGGDKHVGEEIDCEVVRIFQTVAGKMIFVQPKRI